MQILTKFLPPIVAAFFLIGLHYTIGYSEENEPVEPLLIESFIAFQVAGGHGDDFYRVMTDQNETPYLDIEEVLSEFLTLAATCNPNNLSCDTIIRPDNTSYWLDGLTLKFGNSREKKSELSIPVKSLILTENKIWLRYDILEKWLPVKVIWDIEQYFLKITPLFPLKNEILRKRDEARNNAREKQKEKELFESQEILVPDERYRGELRVKASLKYTNHYDSGSNSGPSSILTGDYNGDILKGNLKINSIYSLSEDKYDFDPSLIRWNYKRTEQKNFHLLEAGNIYQESTILTPSVFVENGLNIKKLENKLSGGVTDFSGIVRQGAEVDLFRNGFLIETIKADDDGLYIFRDISVTDGDRVVIRAYFSDGSDQIKEYIIAPDGGTIIQKSQWDAQLFSGFYNSEDKKSPYAHGMLRYGFLHNFSAAVHSYLFPDQITSDLKPNNIHGLDFSWKLFPAIQVSTEHLYSGSSSGHGLSVDSTYFNSNIQFVSKAIDPASSIYEVQPYDRTSSKYNHLRYSINRHSWFCDFLIFNTSEKMGFDAVVRKKINNRVSLSVEKEDEYFNSGQSTEVTKIYGEYSTTEHHLKILRSFDEYFNITYRYQGMKKSNWDFSFAINRYDNDDWDTSATLSWKPYKGTKTDHSVTDRYSSHQISYESLITGPNGPDNPDHFATGTLFGKVLLRDPESGKITPVEGAIVQASSYKALSDKDGNYTIHGLPVNQKISARILPSSIDIDYVPSVAVTAVKFRPGTAIEYNPEVIKTIGIDGILDCYGIISEDATIEAKLISTGEIISSSKVESDGFFILERLIPGRYQFIIKGVGNKPQVFEYIATDKTDWVSSVHFGCHLDLASSGIQ